MRIGFEAVPAPDLHELYRTIDSLLAARARDYPERREPTWSALDSALQDSDALGLVAAAFAAVRVETGLAPRPPLYWVEKTPTHELAVDAIRARYPAAKFVHLVRDPRATAASMRKLGMEDDAWAVGA